MGLSTPAPRQRCGSRVIISGSLSALPNLYWHVFRLKLAVYPYRIRLQHPCCCRYGNKLVGRLSRHANARRAPRSELRSRMPARSRNATLRSLLCPPRSEQSACHYVGPTRYLDARRALAYPIRMKRGFCGMVAISCETRTDARRASDNPIITHIAVGHASSVSLGSR